MCKLPFRLPSKRHVISEIVYNNMKYIQTGIKIHKIRTRPDGSEPYVLAEELLPNGVASFEGPLNGEVDLEVGA